MHAERLLIQEFFWCLFNPRRISGGAVLTEAGELRGCDAADPLREVELEVAVNDVVEVKVAKR